MREVVQSNANKRKAEKMLRENKTTRGPPAWLAPCQYSADIVLGARLSEKL